MVRHARANAYEDSVQPVIAVGNSYAAGHRHPPHRHRRSQLLYAEVGTMLVDTDDGGWLVPPHEAVWIPGGTLHGIRMQSPVETRSVYFDADTAHGFPTRCQVIEVSPLLRQLLIRAVELPIDHAPDSHAGKIMALIVEEARAAPELPLCVPFPAHPKLGAECRRFSSAPSIGETTESWASKHAMSRRSFTRLFRRETGLSFSEWQRRTCLQAALPRLLNGDAITGIAVDLGYGSPAAFTAMFNRYFGCSPSEYVRSLR